MGSFKTLALLFLVSAFVYLPTSKSDASFINKICGQTPNPDLCNSIFLSDPRALSFDTGEMALMLVDKIKENAVATMGQIDVLSKAKPELKKQLNTCRESYEAILEDDVGVAQQALSLGNPKFGEGAVADIGIEADICETGFNGNSPLTNSTTQMQQITDITGAIIRLLL